LLSHEKARRQRHKLLPLPLAGGGGAGAAREKFPGLLFCIVVRLFRHCCFALVDCSFCAASFARALRVFFNDFKQPAGFQVHPAASPPLYFFIVFLLLFTMALLFLAAPRQRGSAPAARPAGLPLCPNLNVMRPAPSIPLVGQYILIRM
jgi:hypothetical protein